MIVSVAARWREEFPDGDRELARFNHPAVETRGPVRERSLVELAAHLLGFARLEVHLGETLQLAKRPRHRRLHIPHIHLNNLGASPLTDVADRRRHGHRKIAVLDRPGNRDLDIVDAEAGVGQAKPERVTHVLDQCVVAR